MSDIIFITIASPLPCKIKYNNEIPTLLMPEKAKLSGAFYLSTKDTTIIRRSSEKLFA